MLLEGVEGLDVCVCVSKGFSEGLRRRRVWCGEGWVFFGWGLGVGVCCYTVSGRKCVVRNSLEGVQDVVCACG